MTAAEESIRYLWERIAIIQGRVRRAVEVRRLTDTNPEDPFRGLYVSDEQVDELLASNRRWPAAMAAGLMTEQRLAELEEWADHAEARGAVLRLRRMARSFQLDGVDVEILLIALAPDLDPRFERLYGYLNDDVSRRRASIALALELSAATGVDREPETGSLLARFHPEAALCASGLLIVEEPDHPFLTRPLRVPDRVTAHLLGDDRPDALTSPFVVEAATTPAEETGPIERALAAGVRLFYIRESQGAAGMAFAASGLAAAGVAAFALDLSLVGEGHDAEQVAMAAVREARLRDAALLAGPIDAVVDGQTAWVRTLAQAYCAVLLCGSRSWDPTWSKEVPLLLEASTFPRSGQEALWRRYLDGSGPSGIDLMRGMSQFRLTPEQVRRAATFALQNAWARGSGPEIQDLQAGARAQNAGGLERLTRRIEPRVSWPDLVLPVDTIAQLRELSARARLGDQVLLEWGVGRTSTRGRGVSALFAGDSGTGKTMSAEVIARDLGLDLYVIDLATVVDKYIGETEKNLERIFVEADRVNAVLLFDEADAIFGKRSDVQDAHDRYANVEIAYLLQRMERFNGLAILTTNLRANVDEAFTRRLDAIIDFPMPDERDRLLLWQLHLGRGMPLASDVDVGFLARSFKMSGGNISNVTLAAAFLAAEEQTAVGMSHLIRATEREYRKLGHLCVPEEFGAYYPLIVPAP